MLAVIAAYVVAGFVIVRIVRRYPTILGRLVAFVASAIAAYAVIFAWVWMFTYPGFVEIAGERAAAEIAFRLTGTSFKFALGGCVIMAIGVGRRKRSQATDVS